MPRRFLFDQDAFELPTVEDLRVEWRNVPDSRVRNVIAVEAQYLAFHQFLIRSIRHQAIEGSDPIPIGLSVRAGALKSESLLCASIVEAALRCHAEARGLPLSVDQRRRTFGNVLSAWELSPGRPHADLAPIWPDLRDMHLGRNTVHLHAALQGGGNFYDLLEEEERSLASKEVVLLHVKALVSS